MSISPASKKSGALRRVSAASSDGGGSIRRHPELELAGLGDDDEDDLGSGSADVGSHRRAVEIEPLMIDAADDDDDGGSSSSFGVVGGDTAAVKKDHRRYDDGHGGAPPGSATVPQVIVNIIISFVGAGLLGVPNAFSKSGWLLGSLTLCATSALNLYALLLLPKIKRKLLSQGYDAIISYGDMGRCVLGKRGETFVNACIAVSQAGFATAYIIFIAANLYNVAEIPRFLSILACVPGLAVLVQFDDMKFLSPFSLLANCSTFTALVAVLFQDYETIAKHYREEMDFGGHYDEPGPPIAAAVDNSTRSLVGNGTAIDNDPTAIATTNAIQRVKWGGMMYVIAITIYSMEGVALILSLEASCKKPSMFPFLLQSVVGSITLFMAMFGTAGYWAFGDDTEAPITLNLAGHWIATFVKLALCFSLYFTYPVMMFPVWHILEASNTSGGSSSINSNNPKSKVAVRAGVVVASAFVAWSVPDFGKFLSLVGSSICTILGFICPCYFYLVCFGRDEIRMWQYALNCFLIVGGALFGMVGTYNSLVALLFGGDGGMPDR